MLGSSPSGTAALVGRQSELLAVQAAFDEAAAGRPTLVLLVGEAGIGKTRLADEAALIARAAGTRVLRGEADAASRESMELWRGVYRALGVVPVSHPSLRAEERRWEHLESLVDALVSCGPSWLSSTTCIGPMRSPSGCSNTCRGRSATPRSFSSRPAAITSRTCPRSTD